MPSSLHLLLAPRSIAVIGASADSESLSGRPAGILRAYGFDGLIFLVNPNHEHIDGTRTFESIRTVPVAVDVALIAVPAPLVISVLQECASAGVRFAVVFSSGFAEQDLLGIEAERIMADIAAKSGMRILGPNGEGFVSNRERIAATFSPAIPVSRKGARTSTGDIAVITQSGGLGFAMLGRGDAVGLDINYVVSTGNEADLDLTDIFEHLLLDDVTRVIVLLLEGLRDPERFSALASVARTAGKPVIVAKLGRTVVGARAALSHTAHDTGVDHHYEQIFRDNGILRVDDDEEILDSVMALDRSPRAAGSNVGIVTTSGGAGVLLADLCTETGLQVPLLPSAIQETLRLLMPAFGSATNPVDVTAAALASDGLAKAVEVLLGSPDVDAIALICSLASPHMLEREGEAIARLVRTGLKPVVMYTYTSPSERSLALLSELRLAWYPSARRTARALRMLLGHWDSDTEPDRPSAIRQRENSSRAITKERS
jgi:acyl-CoA synthetase (NDP forming)